MAGETVDLSQKIHQPANVGRVRSDEDIGVRHHVQLGMQSNVQLVRLGEAKRGRRRVCKFLPEQLMCVDGSDLTPFERSSDATRSCFPFIVGHICREERALLKRITFRHKFMFCVWC